jgi:hypothetical protein
MKTMFYENRAGRRTSWYTFGVPQAHAVTQFRDFSDNATGLAE